MPTKDRTAVSVYIPNEWIPAIDDKRGNLTLSAWILETIRTQLGKKDFAKPAGRGRPRKEA
jgi:hypothetical protein